MHCHVGWFHLGWVVAKCTELEIHTQVDNSNNIAKKPAIAAVAAVATGL